MTLNYRLGIFGTFGYPGLEGSGGFGLEDQQAALRWVQRNAAAFGGDAGTVMLFGESYGALATTAQLTSPSADGLFQRAAVQSDLTLHDYPAGTIAPGSPALPSLWASTRELEELGASLAPELGCPDPATLTCLRALPAAALLPLSQVFTRYGYGNAVLPEDPSAALRAGRFHDVPVLAGATRDEHRLYTAAFYDLAGAPVTEQSYAQLLAEAFGPAAADVATRYPLSDYPSPSLAWSAVVTDRLWATAIHEQFGLLSARVPTFAYEFADPDAPPVVEFPPGFPPGAHHSSEVFYQFDAAGGGEFAGTAGEFSALQRALAGQLNSYWAAFARTGDPNAAAAAPPWPSFGEGGHVQSLAPGPDGIGPVDYPAEHHLDFWAALR